MALISDWVLDAVERWADGYWLIRETGIGVVGRLDGLLVPVSRAAHCMKRLKEPLWKRPRLVGVEVKTSRADFQRGLKNQQYERYAESVSGLYVATLVDVCRTSELPDGVGHLLLNNRRGVHSTRGLICKRHPHYNESRVDAETAWQLLFVAKEQFIAETHKRNRRQAEVIERIGANAAGRIFKPLRQIEQAIEAEFARKEHAF